MFSSNPSPEMYKKQDKRHVPNNSSHFNILNFCTSAITIDWFILELLALISIRSFLGV